MTIADSDVLIDFLNGATLLTRNLDHFRRVPGLQIAA
jgi:predicted nucleic acid-binding protein